jgi:RNA polymerase sigma factor (sigma-70 family)
MANHCTPPPDFADAIPFAIRSAEAKSSVSLFSRAGGFGPDDLVQEGLIAVWRGLAGYDPLRSSLRTFAERVVTTKLRSILRSQRALKRTWRDQYSERAPIQVIVNYDVQIGVRVALTRLNSIDTRIARLLLREYRPAEITKILKVSRAGVYRSIARIRLALSDAGYK